MTNLPASLVAEHDNQTNYGDIPTWYEEDKWIYTADPVVFSGDFGSFTGQIEDLQNTVIGIKTLLHHGMYYEVYELKITGNITGVFSYNSLYGDLEGIVNGTTYLRVSDLAELKTEIYSYGTIEIIVVTLDYEATFFSNFDPPLELYDFPLNVDESWTISCISNSSGSFYLEGFINETFSGNQGIHETLTCSQLENITVPAGTYECYQINRSENSVWYAPEVGNSIQSIIDISEGNTTFHTTLRLTSFVRSIQPVTLSLFLEPNECLIDEQVVISGEAIEPNSGNPLQNENISITIPATGHSWTTITDENGDYNLIINAPEITDETPSGDEIGSDGIVARCFFSNILSQRVQTLVIRENNPPDTPTITGITEGNVGEEYNYTFQTLDANDDVIFYYIDWGDGNIVEWIGPYESGEEITISHIWDEKGDYTIKAKAKDHYDAESNWGYLDITMPVHQQSINNLRIYNGESNQKTLPFLNKLFNL
jgi:hypothetical protein